MPEMGGDERTFDEAPRATSSTASAGGFEREAEDSAEVTSDRALADLDQEAALEDSRGRQIRAVALADALLAAMPPQRHRHWHCQDGPTAPAQMGRTTKTCATSGEGEGSRWRSRALRLVQPLP